MNDFVDQVLDKVFTILSILVALDDLRNKETSFNVVLHHIEEEIDLRQEMLLTIPVLDADLKQKVDNNLEQAFVCDHLVVNLLEQIVDQLVYQADI